MSLDNLDNVILIMIFGQAHIVQIIEPTEGEYLATWDDRPILYPNLTHYSKLEALVEVVAKIAELHSVAENRWRMVGA